MSVIAKAIASLLFFLFILVQELAMELSFFSWGSMSIVITLLELL